MLTREVRGRVFSSATLAAGVFICLDLLASDRVKDPVDIQQQRFVVEQCISRLLKLVPRTEIAKEGTRTLRRLLELEYRQRHEPEPREHIMQAILGMAHETERGLSPQDDFMESGVDAMYLSDDFWEVSLGLLHGGGE